MRVDRNKIKQQEIKWRRCMITQVGQKLIGKRTGNGAKNRSSTSRIKNYVCVGLSEAECVVWGEQVGFQPPWGKHFRWRGTRRGNDSTSRLAIPVSCLRYDRIAPSPTENRYIYTQTRNINIINFLYRLTFINLFPRPDLETPSFFWSEI